MSEFVPEPVRRPREQVESQLREAILSGTLPDGHKLPGEIGLAHQFGVSRTTVREALRSLAEAGLIRTTPGSNGGSFVVYFDHHDLAALVSERLINTVELGSISYDELTAFRLLIEVPAAGMAARNRSEDQLARLRGSVERARAAAPGGPPAHEINREFHVELADATGNRLVAAFLKAAAAVTLPIARPFAPVAGLTRDVVADHMQIVEAIAARDVEKAERLARDHLEFVQDQVARRVASPAH